MDKVNSVSVPGKRKPLINHAKEETAAKNDAAPTGENDNLIRGRYMSVFEASKITGIKKDFFYNHIKKGTLPFPWYSIYPGKKTVNITDIVEWMERCKVPAFSTPGDIKGGNA